MPAPTPSPSFFEQVAKIVSELVNTKKLNDKKLYEK